MKVIFLQNVKKQGLKGEIKEVGDGYARNFLIPNKFAKEASQEAIKDLKIKNETEKNKIQKENDKLKELIQKINSGGEVIEISARANEKNHLFKSIKKTDIITKIKKLFNMDISQDIILMNDIKELGGHQVKITKDGQEWGAFTVKITKE